MPFTDINTLGGTATFEDLFNKNNTIIDRLNALDVGSIVGGTGILVSSISGTGGITLFADIRGGTGISITSSASGGITMSVNIIGGTGIDITSSIGGTTLSVNIKGGTGISVTSSIGGTTLSSNIRGGTGILLISSATDGITLIADIRGGTGISVTSSISGGITLSITPSSTSLGYAKSASRTMAEIANNGFTTGHVVHYNFTTSPVGFTTSQANDFARSEVFGIVETILGSTATIIMQGSIDLTGASGSRLNIIGSGGSGASDIWFLSGTTTGHMQNEGPTLSGTIVKPVYYASPHNVYGVTFTGIVVTYTGFKNA